MLSVHARDGAGRSGVADLGGRKLEFPNLLWVDEELGSAEASWAPTISRKENPGALILIQTSLRQKPPAPQGGQLLLERRLGAMPAMNQGRSPLRSLAGQVAVMEGAAALFRNPRRFAAAIAHARREAGYGQLLYAPGLGDPAHLAVLAYAGIDLADSVGLSLAAVQGRFLTEHGSFPAASLASAQCMCPACGFQAPATFDEATLRRHNQHAARQELGVIQNAIRHGRLRELVEARVRSHPELTALLRRLDAQYEHFEERVPITRREPLYATTKESLSRPDVLRFRRRVAERYQPKSEAPALLLLPCSHRKPYSKSRTHRAFNDAIWEAGAATLVQEVIVTSPLGIVPRELELTYPAAHYDVPVTGEWDEEEGRMIRDLLKGLLSKRPGVKVISHLPKHTHELVADLLPSDTTITCHGEDATKGAELGRLGVALRDLRRGHRPRSFGHVMRERHHGLATYQFGPDAANALMDGATVDGKWPTGKVMVGREQLAMLPTERGLLSLTLAGARRIAATGAYVVEIEDFPITGSIFAVGVKDADPQIRVGDEVIVAHNGDVRAVGVAAMTGPEMTESERGEAVKVRHHV